MKANELRIGNLVYDTLGKVNKIDLEAITYIVKEPYDRVKPIQLTEEILVNWCGFYVKFDSFLFKLFCITITKSKGGLKKEIPLLFNKNYYGELDQYPFFFEHFFRIKYLHQLQNLIYSLTGEELPINHPSTK